METCARVWKTVRVNSEDADLKAQRYKEGDGVRLGSGQATKDWEAAQHGCCYWRNGILPPPSSSSARRSVGYSFEFDAGNTILRLTGAGQLTDEMLLDAHSAGKRWMASRSARGGILDLTAVTAVDLSNETIQKLTMMQPIFGVESKVVVVAPKDVYYGLARMFATLGEQSRPNWSVVRTIEEAYRLLGVETPQFSRVAIE